MRLRVVGEPGTSLVDVYAILGLVQFLERDELAYDGVRGPLLNRVAI
jgi:hypothetical protein